MDENLVRAIVARSISGSRVNQLGGSYRNGKPLSQEMRRRVIELSLSGVRPCEISRQLKITHGCISKLLSKFFKTGSLTPGHGTAGRPRVITPWIEKHIDRYRKEQPGIFSWEIRERLLRENVCFETTLPSLSSINRLVKSKIKQQSLHRDAKNISRERNGDNQHDKNKLHSKSLFKYSIDNILSSDRYPKVRSFSYQPVLHSAYSHEIQQTEEERSNDSMEEWKTLWTHQEPADNDKKFIADSSERCFRRQRIRFTTYQMKYLEKEFELNSYPSHAERTSISQALDVEEAKIRIWFSNRRAKVKRTASPISSHTLSYPETPSKACHCTCNHSKEPIILPVHLNPGPSRLFFPPGYRPLH